MTVNAKQMASKEIEINSFRDKINSLENKIKDYENKIVSLQYDLEQSQESYLELYKNDSNVKKKHENA